MRNGKGYGQKRVAVEALECVDAFAVGQRRSG